MKKGIEMYAHYAELENSKARFSDHAVNDDSTVHTDQKALAASIGEAEQAAGQIAAADPFALAHRPVAVDTVNEQDDHIRYESIRRVVHSTSGLLGTIILTLIVLFALLGPLVSDYAPNTVNMNMQNLPPRLPMVERLGFWNGETRGEHVYVERGVQQVYHYFGTDTLGRDLWTRVATGTRISLFVAMVAVCIDIVIGITYGMISGYFGGRVDLIMQRMIEVIASIPSLVVITLFMIILKPGLMTIIIALMITNWIGMSRIVRAQVLRLKRQDYVLAARTLGASDIGILLREILPNLYGTIIMMAMMSIPEAIFIESFLSFIGLGIPEPTASLGTLISTGFKSMMIHPYMVAIPVVVFASLMISFNLLSDSLRDALDSKLKL
ncbi:ABC transporter permease [Paenibacillus campi]|uniref:ABC transporter permease n=1 Tax=Paenibacillus campi TaxID=3106031 RepID=UPI002AFF2BE8|nr:ABC transporter permease [Paenibacillus sp. SGZ-1009]